MNLSTLLSNLCSRVPGEDLTDKQILSIKSDLGSARNAAQNMALGVAAVGNLLANVGAEGEVGQETSERLGWFLEEIGGGHLHVGGARAGLHGTHQPAEGGSAMRATLGISFRATAPVDLSKGDHKTNVLCVKDDIDADLALDSATDLLDAVIGGLQEIVSEPSVSSQVSLMLHAVETAQALVRAALEGVEVPA
ncbi:hypothetical protein ABZQ19_01065 [Pseudomonas aeruginosa]|uniref:hypothetical protein n=2 Tax=Pseudomonas aeruginosa TaxID=287 RepID=UPI0023A9EAE9|nr:hypothetical protein [Pseudomonas aeruginosa]MDE5047631.1 hypothetical protein [Pseudomonas aeruginosa]